MHPVDVWLEMPDKPPTRHAQRLLERKKFLINPCDSILSGKIVVYRDLSRKKFRLNGCSAPKIATKSCEVSAFDTITSPFSRHKLVSPVARKCLLSSPRLPHAMDAGSQSAICVRGRDAYGWFRAVFFHMMSHLSDTSTGFGGEVVRRKLLHCTAGEPLFRLIPVGD
jgi:hypothetical protein